MGSADGAGVGSTRLMVLVLVLARLMVLVLARLMVLVLARLMVVVMVMARFS